jgi:hypothetical protein
MDMPKQDLRALRRLLYRHQWTDILEWGLAVGALADLSDAQIDIVAAPDRDAGDRTSGAREKTGR